VVKTLSVSSRVGYFCVYCLTSFDFTSGIRRIKLIWSMSLERRCVLQFLEVEEYSRCNLDSRSLDVDFCFSLAKVFFCGEVRYFYLPGLAAASVQAM
jgi:hypothetical protein